MTSKYGPQNAILGDDTMDQLPQMKMPEQDLTDERNAARFSKTKEFAKLKKHLTDRIEYYQGFLPDGRPMVGSTDTYAELGSKWLTANAIITEFNAIIGAYEQAAAVVKEADAAGRQNP